VSDFRGDWVKEMDRRDLLSASVAVAAGVVALSTAAPSRSATPTSGPTFGKPGRGQLKSASFIATRDGTALFYRDWGAGNGVVFASPWALGCDWWEYQMVALANQGMRCIAYDRRGQDRSEQSRQGYDFDTLADDLDSILDSLDLRNITLVAHSMGGGEAVRYLSRHGSSRVGRLVLVASITPSVLKTLDNPGGFDPAFLAKVRAALCQDRPGIIASAAPGFFGAPGNTVSAEMMQWWAQQMLCCPLNSMLELHHAFTETDFSADVRKITVPTLIIHGDNDASAPIDVTARRAAAMIAGSRLAVYEGAAHGLPITHMDRLNRDLMAFARA
jgi:non-heme chloroperoxidase